MGNSYSVNRSLPSRSTQLDGTRLEAPLPPPRRWSPDRAGEVRGEQPRGEMLGNPGPDAGYVLKLLHLVWPRIGLLDGESRHDLEAALAATALRRASLGGRGPIFEDVEWAAVYWGVLPETAPVGDQSPSKMRPRERALLFGGCSHEFDLQREIAAHAAADLFELKPDQLAAAALAAAGA